MEKKRNNKEEEKARRSVYYMGWEESERGWGQRPDGCSLHIGREDYDSFLKEYWEGMPSSVPDEYSRPAGDLVSILVSEDIYKQIQKEKNGLRLWQYQLIDLREKGDLDYQGQRSGWMPVPLKTGRLEGEFE